MGVLIRCIVCALLCGAGSFAHAVLYVLVPVECQLVANGGVGVPAINNQGIVAYRQGERLVLAQGAARTVVAQETPTGALFGREFTQIGRFALNDLGQVAFWGVRYPGALPGLLVGSASLIPQWKALYWSDPGPLDFNSRGEIVVKEGRKILASGAFAPLVGCSKCWFVSSALNEAGHVFLLENLDSEYAIWRQDFGPTVWIDPSHFWTGPKDLSSATMINSDAVGKVVVAQTVSTPIATREEIVLFRPGEAGFLALPPVRLVTARVIDPAVGLNNLEQIAYVANYGAERGLYLGPESTRVRIVRQGGALLGSTIARVEISRDSLNDAGQMAFRVELTDGRQCVMKREFDSIVLPPPGPAPVPR